MSDTFVPAKGLENPHLQTLLPRFLRRKPAFSPVWERLELPDGDFVDLAWTENPETAKGKPVAVLFHGLEGCFYSPYAHGLLDAYRRQGWLGVIMHFRSCSGAPNRHPRSYHSGETGDARFFLETLKSRFPDTRVAAAGVSLGGNMLVRYLAEYRDAPLIDAACVVSAPLDLSSCSERIQQGFSKVYQAYLLGSMKRKLATKLQHHGEVGRVSGGSDIAIRNIYQFDDMITAPLHGFADAEDYYQRCSGLSVLSSIKVPLKVIHAKDDPFMTDAVIPAQPLPDNIEYHLCERGGHVGFISGTLRKPEYWLDKTVPAFFSRYLSPANAI